MAEHSPPQETVLALERRFNAMGQGGQASQRVAEMATLVTPLLLEMARQDELVFYPHEVRETAKAAEIEWKTEYEMRTYHLRDMLAEAARMLRSNEPYDPTQLLGEIDLALKTDPID